MGMVPSSVFLELDLVEADKNIAEMLGIKERDLLYLLERLRLGKILLLPMIDRIYPSILYLVLIRR